MAGFAKPDRNAFLESDPLLVGHALDQTAHFFSLGRRVERDLGMAGSTAFFLMALFLLSGVLFLDLGRVEEYDREEIGAGRCCQDFIPESLANEFGEKPGMVEMDVGEEDEIERSGRDGKGCPVPFEIGSLLEQTAIDEQPEAGRLDEIAGTSDLLGSAEELNPQNLSLPDRS
jgi:hypothetical protein